MIINIFLLLIGVIKIYFTKTAKTKLHIHTHNERNSSPWCDNSLSVVLARPKNKSTTEFQPHLNSILFWQIKWFISAPLKHSFQWLPKWSLLLRYSNNKPYLLILSSRFSIYLWLTLNKHIILKAKNIIAHPSTARNLFYASTCSLRDQNKVKILNNTSYSNRNYYYYFIIG